MYNALMFVPMNVLKQLAALTEKRLLATEDREGMVGDNRDDCSGGAAAAEPRQGEDGMPQAEPARRGSIGNDNIVVRSA